MSSQPRAITKWELWLDGPHLRGANINQRRVYPDVDGLEFYGPGPLGPPILQSDIDGLAAMGANYVNISHSGLFTIDPPYEVDPDVQANLDRLLKMIEQADMFAVISFRSGPGRSEFALFYGEWLDPIYFNDAVWQDPTIQQAWVDMWRYTAERYHKHPIVVGYDLMVEPNSNDSGSNFFQDRLEIWEPEWFYSHHAGSLYDWNQWYPQISNAIRALDAHTPILIAGNGYSGVDWLPYLEPTEDSKTVYMVHQYEPQGAYTHKEWSDDDFQASTYPGVLDTDGNGEQESFDRNWLVQFLEPIEAFMSEHQAPVAVNEFGVVRWAQGGAEFMNDQMGLFEELGINHALWLWQPDWEPLNEIDFFNFRHGPDPNHHEPVKDSALMDVIRSYWERNSLRPSQVSFSQSFLTHWCLYP